jgi:hypothetical protein
VGRYHFRVRALSPDHPDGQLLEIYYDRAPQDSDHRKGQWFLVSELEEVSG